MSLVTGLNNFFSHNRIDAALRDHRRTVDETVRVIRSAVGVDAAEKLCKDIADKPSSETFLCSNPPPGPHNPRKP